MGKWIYSDISPTDFAPYKYIQILIHRGGKRGGSREETSQKVSKSGRQFWGKSYAWCRIFLIPQNCLKSCPFLEKYINHNFCFHDSDEIQFPFLKFEWNSLLLKHFFFSKLFLRIKLRIFLLRNSARFFSQNDCFLQKIFQQILFYRKRSSFFFFSLWFSKIYDCRNFTSSGYYLGKWSSFFLI